MRNVLIAIGCMTAVVLAAQPVAAATKKERRRICAARGATLASSRLARVFLVDRDGDRSLYGCMRSDGRLQLLATWYSCGCSTGDDPDPSVRLRARRFVELTEYESCGPQPAPDCGGEATTLRDLRSRHEAAVQGALVQVVAGPAGAFAFSDGRVVLVAGDGIALVLDPGPGVEPGSLAFARTRLYWTRDGLPRSAPLQ
jgi:hypothetical protein